MAQVRCPQCGAVTGTNAPDYPFCIGCQDNLAKCGYCRWFDREAGVCLNPSVAGLFDPAPDATPPCDQHAPGDYVLIRSRATLPLAVLGIGVALLVLVYAVFALREPTQPARVIPTEYLKWEMAANYHGAVGVPCKVTVEMQNPMDHDVSGIRLQISKESLRHFTLQEVVPKADATENGHEWLSLIYPALHPQETKRLNLVLLPRRAGTFAFDARLVSSGNLFHGQNEVLIVVASADT